MRVYEATEGTTYRGDNRRVWLILANSFMEASFKAEEDVREWARKVASHAPAGSSWVSGHELRSLVLLGEAQ
jgi:hypothetical protein